MLDLQPLEGRNKVFIIDPADLMNDGSSECTLKGLEEPPENSFFILITVNVHELASDRAFSLPGLQLHAA